MLLLPPILRCIQHKNKDIDCWLNVEFCTLTLISNLAVSFYDFIYRYEHIKRKKYLMNFIFSNHYCCLHLCIVNLH